MTERTRRLMEYHFAENNDTRITKRTVARIVKKVADKAGQNPSPLTLYAIPS
jgi:integrase/recombinase XerD